MKTLPFPYEPPRIETLEVGRMNRTAYGAQTDYCAEIEGVPVSELLEQHGSPLFVFSERKLRETYRQAQAAFSKRYPNVQFAWSYKTNYLKAICNVFHEEGAWAEVVSEFEYQKARALGIPGKQIIFNGPHKPRAILRQALREGARIQVDHLEELLMIEELVSEEEIHAPAISLRVYLDAGIRPVWSKFGFNLDDGEAWRTAQRLHHGGILKLSGLHTHIGTYILDPGAYRMAARKLITFAQKLKRELDIEIDTLNLGGGFASRNTLHGQYLPAEQVVPGFDAYAEAISEGILDHLLPGQVPPKLLLETGRALVDEAGYLLTTVVANKVNRLYAEVTSVPVQSKASAVALSELAPTRGSHALLLDAGVHLLYAANWYRFKIVPARRTPGMPTPTTLYGCLCMNIDVIQEATPLPALSPGDALVIHPVGAYNLTQSMQFIAYRPRVVMIMEDRRVEVIREREDLRYVEEMERMPASARHNRELAIA